MRIGIVTYQLHDKRGQSGLEKIIQIIMMMGGTPFILDGTILSEHEILHRVQKSPIKRWIFSGSDHTVLDQDHLQVPMALLNTDKKFMMICYAMQSILYQLGIPIKRRHVNRYEEIHMTIPKEHRTNPLLKNVSNPMTSWRDHQWYFSKVDIPPSVTVLASYRGEAMIATYKNAVLHHLLLEKTLDGLEFFKNWFTLD
jgi:GMP synthase-like glutamine amidotransferase